MAAPADVYYGPTEQSDFGKIEGSDMLVRPYQLKRSYPGINAMNLFEIPFDAPAFNKRNEVQIPALPLNVVQLYLQIKLTAEGTVTNGKWQPTPTWINSQGVDLNFQNKSCYNANEAELLMSCILDKEHANFIKEQNMLGFNLAADGAATAQYLYLDLNLLSKNVLRQVGPMNSYASNSWSIAVDLKSASLCMSNSTTAETPDATISEMKLMLIGSTPTAEEVDTVRKHLSAAGIMWHSLQPHHFRATLADNAGSTTTYTIQPAGLVGSLAMSRLCIRNKATLDASCVSTKNNVNWQVYQGIGDKINCGKTSQPFAVWGTSLPQEVARNLFCTESLRGGCKYLIVDENNQNYASGLDTGIFSINWQESKSDLEYGTSTGSYPVKNDFQVQLTMASDTVQDNYVDMTSYKHVKNIITSNGIVSVESS